MSIVVSVKVCDAIILGADSTTQLTNRDRDGNIHWVQSFHHARKLFPIKGLNIGILTYGVGNIGKRSVESYLLDYTAQLQEENVREITIQMITERLMEFLAYHYNEQYSSLPAEQWPTLGIYVAGYSPGSKLAEEYEFVIPQLIEVRKVREAGDFGASWRGDGNAFTRIYKGYDPGFVQILKNSGLESEIMKYVQKQMKDLTATIIFDGMPPQDAVNFCKFILNTTVTMAKYTAGPSSCGGPLDIAIITRNRGFGWIDKKKLIDYHRED